MKKILQFLFFLGLGVTIMTLVFRSQNAAFQEQCRLDGVPADQCSLLDKLQQDFSSVHIGWMLAVVLAFTLSNVFRALRWQMQFEPLGYRAGFANAFWSIILGYFANLGFPRMGEVVRAGSLARYEQIPLEKSVGTLVIDRLMDFICLGIVLALAFAFEGDTLWQFITRNQGQGSKSGFFQNQWVQLVGIFFVALGLLAWFLRDKWLKLPLVQSILGILKGFQTGLSSVFKLKQPGMFLLYSAGIWLMFFLQCLFNLKAFAPTAELGASAALMVFVFGTLGFVIPSPGGMGTFHWLCIQALALYGISGSDAYSYAMIAFFAIQIFYNIIGGVLALIILPWQNKKTQTV